MNNQQQSNIYGNQQQQQIPEWSQLAQWQQWQHHFQQSSYQQQPFMAHQPIDHASQFAAPPPPPPESNDQPSTSSMQSGGNRNSNTSNFSQANRGQNNNRSNQWRGNQRNRGNTRSSGNETNRNQFANSQSFPQNSSSNNDNSSMMNSNFNESNSQRQGNNFNNSNSNRGGRNQRNSRNNRKNPAVGNRQQDSSYSGPTSFSHSIPSSENVSLSQSAPYQFNAPPLPQSTSFQNSVPFQQPSAPFSSVSDSQAKLTEEDKAFEEEFRKWEIQFQEWIDQNKYHPDKQKYKQYEKQFQDVREKLLNRREEMRRRQLQVISEANTPQQIAFENQWNSAPKASIENATPLIPPPSEPTIFDPKPSTSQLPPPETSQSRDMALSASAILFGRNQPSFQNLKSFERDDLDDDFVCFDDSKVNKPDNVFEDRQNFTIPGLECNKPEEMPKEAKEKDDVIDLDDDQKEPEFDEHSTPMPNETVPAKKDDKLPSTSIKLPRFRPKVNRNIIPINDLLNEPGRSTRPEKIMVLIRGAPGSGKHFLANLIHDKECRMGNDRCKVLSIDRFIVYDYDSNQCDSYNQALYADARNLVREGYMNFILVILNGCTIQQFNKIAHTANSLGGYTCYSIEIHQTREICESYNKNNRSLIDIINGIEDLDRYATPARITVIDPSSLLLPNGQQQQYSAPSQTVTKPSSSTEEEDFAQKMAKILQDKKVMEILQQQLNNKNPPSQTSQLSLAQNFQPPAQYRQQPTQFNENDSLSNWRVPPVNKPNNFEEVPIFKPAKVIDYNHEHIPTFEEKLLEFKIFRVVEYNHRETPTMREFLKDIDLDKIIEKRKAVALRKKILEYLKSAERPEDTVSNPKYPKNWEAIQQDRPPRRNKRKKIKTAKIRRILMQKSREEKSWMTKGYSEMTAQEDMDLEEISSEDDENMDPVEKIPHKVQIMNKVSTPIVITTVEYNDEYKDVEKTIPDFNHFNRSNVIDIRKLLWLPERKKRPNNILIILRGASGSGKSHLVQLIKRKENEMGKDASDIRILCIDDYFLPEDDEEQSSEAQSELIKSYLEEMKKHLKKTINEGLYNFIIIDAENCDLSSYSQFYQIGSTMNFTVFTIELYQTLEICTKQCTRQRSSSDIQNSIDLFSQNPTPSEHTLLIPSALYAQYDCFVNAKISEKPESIGTYRKYLEQTIDDKLLLSNMPIFNWHNREIMNIAEILEDPGRFQRSENIAILLRGPSASGKEELANVIIEKEKQYGNENSKFISITETAQKNPSRFEFSDRSRDDKLEKLLKNLRDVMRIKAHKFLIIDAETGDFANYKQVHELVSSYQYKCYTIELYHDASVCQQNDMEQNAISEIENILEEMQLNPTPDDHVLLNASMFYKQTTNLTDRPLKSALKISPNTSMNINFDHLREKFEKIFSRLDLHAQYESIINQRVKINGEFIKRNEKAPSKLPEFNWFNQDIKDIRDILEEPNRLTRPEKIVIFLRGAPGSGKTFLARLIERREIEKGDGDWSKVKLLALEEFFETEKYQEVENQCEKYIEVFLESTMNDYMEKLSETFKAEVDTNEYTFIVVEGNFCDLKYYNEMWSFAARNNYTCYTIELNQDDDICLKYNDHKWDASVVLENNKMMQTFQTPDNHPLLDPESLYHEYEYQFNPLGAIFSPDEHMDTSDISDAEDNLEEDDDDAFETKFGRFKMSKAVASKWDDVETPDINRLDGALKKSENVTMKDYLQTDDDWSMRPSTSGKKRVRWADIEEKKAQERMRSIGFIVGMTDWNRMTDESDGRNALEKTKYIEPRNKS